MIFADEIGDYIFLLLGHKKACSAYYYWGEMCDCIRIENKD